MSIYIVVNTCYIFFIGQRTRLVSCVTFSRAARATIWKSPPEISGPRGVLCTNLARLLIDGNAALASLWAMQDKKFV